MHSRFAGWRGLFWAAAVASLLLLPLTGAVAKVQVQTTVEKSSGFGTVSEESKIQQPVTYARSNYMWPFATGPVYGQVDSTKWGAAGVLHFAVGSFETRLGTPNFPAELRTTVKFAQQGAQYFVLQVDPSTFTDGTFDRLKSAINDNGGAILQEMAVAGFVVRLNTAGYGALQGQPGVLFLDPYHPAYKLSPMIGRVPQFDPVKALSTVYELNLTLFPGENPAAVAAALAGLGANVTATFPDSIRVEVDRSKLAAIAALEAVASIEENAPLYFHAEETTTTVQTGKWNLGAIPYHDAGIKGSGQALMVLDSGLQLDAGDLSDTKTSPGTAGAIHRKVALYTTTNGFGGSGDTLGCDAPGSGGFTHGHTAAATAAGNGSATAPAYGGSWYATDPVTQKQWKLDGVAPLAKVLMYDANVTSTTTSCANPAASGLLPGNIYTRTTGTPTGSLYDAYINAAAPRVSNFSWGATGNPSYGTGVSGAQRIDQFMFDQKDAIVFVSAGNAGTDANRDTYPDNGSVSDPATTKNGVSVGASNNANDGGADYTKRRASFSSVGPATAASQRVAPLVMAPGEDVGGLGIASEFNCRSNDNDQVGSVECDINQGSSGTSFASPAAAGSAMLVREYFAKGFYPDGTDLNPTNSADVVPNVSGALLKAVLIASADFLEGWTSDPTRYRFNNEQGYGRIQLNNVLPLVTYTSPAGLIVADGGIPGGKNSIGSLSGTANPSTTETYTFTVSDTSRELRIALAWIEDAGDTLAKNLDLELVSPTGKTYWGNYFTDDNNKNRSQDAGEDCAVTPFEVLNTVDNSKWSLPTCANSIRDTQNPTEAIFLSPDFKGNGLVDNPNTPIDESEDNQLEAGQWTVRVIGRSFAGSQPYAFLMAGPVTLGSSVRFKVLRYNAVTNQDLEVTGAPVCNDKARLIVTEFQETPTSIDDTTLHTQSTIQGRTTVQVIDKGTDGVFGTGDDVVTDQEAGTAFTFTKAPGTENWESSTVLLTDGTAPDPGNGALDIREGQMIKVTYQDTTNGSPDADKKRTSQLVVSCKVAVNFGGINFGQFGRDTATFINGGCERDKRGLFSFGFPDRYMDHGEKVSFNIAFQSGESSITLEDVVATLKAVVTDGDSPSTCLPNTTDCADPNRTNNGLVPTGTLKILDSPKSIGALPPGSVAAANFSIEMGSTIAGKQTIEMILGLSAKKSGKPVEGIAVSRQTINAEETSFLYSTDFPTGGTQNVDWNNNETLENPGNYKGDVNWTYDYRFETVTWSDLTAGGTRNPSSTLKSPWNFDTNNGGFTVGLQANSNTNIVATIANWGEDKNFNDVLESGEDRDPANGGLDNNWNTRGGCGWQTKGTAATGGAWHTGRIDVTSGTCIASGGTAAQCQYYETYPGINGTSYWWDILATPVIQKVNNSADYYVEFTNIAWNMAADLTDSLAVVLWDFDTDTNKLSPNSIQTDGAFNGLSGAYGTVTTGNSPLTDGYVVFADFSSTASTATSKNGTRGNNRAGKNPCFFEQKANRGTPFGFAKPLDDDRANGYCQNPSDTNDKQKSCTYVCSNDTTRSCDTAADCTGGGTTCESGAGTVKVPACNVTPYNGTCVRGDSVADEYVQVNGPIRNMDFSQVNGVDLRFTTLEDIYGDSGTNFQGAMGFLVAEGTVSTVPGVGFGATIDDMVVEWREIRLDEDTTTNCGLGGACASIDLQSTNFFDGLARLNVTVLDTSRGNASGNNNCDFNYACYNNPATICTQDSDCGTGTTALCNQMHYGDPGDDNDCDNNGTVDVVARATSDAELKGEWIVLNQDPTNAYQYKASLPISTAYNSPGVLFLSAVGQQTPSVTVRYWDDNDGAGNKCKNNDPDPTKQGFTDAFTAVFVPTGTVVVTGYDLDDNGDNDNIADAGETVTMSITVSNKTSGDISNVVARLATNDSKIECISAPFLSVGSIPRFGSVTTTQRFTFKVADTAQRSSATQDFSSKFVVSLTADQFDTTLAPQELTLDLDLNITGGSGPSSFSESFEGGLGQFTAVSYDTGLASNTLSNGKRCQYNDPDFPNANSYGETECYLGFAGALGSLNTNQWHAHGTNSPGGGRAYAGNASLHWGFHQNAANADNDTTKFSQMDAVVLTSAVNLGYPPATAGNPELSFKQQISLLDYRFVNAAFLTGPDRGVVQLRLNDGVADFGNWIKIFPYENIYDAQATYNYINCTFDPDDDGNNEDSYFDPSDPFRVYGPSSTCFPEFNFISQGDTDYRNKYIPGNVNRASDDRVGLQGSIDRGTWVTSKFNLQRFAGRRAKLRFLATTIKVSDVPDPINLGFPNKTPRDDGWYMDDMVISNTLTSAATVAVDGATPPGGTVCGTNCTAVTAALSSTPSSLGAPGGAVTLTAAASSADKCVNGTLLYQFWNDANNNGTVGDGGDVLLRDYIDNPVLVDAPAATTRYGVKVTCSSALTCVGTTTTTVSVTCPSSGLLAFQGSLGVAKTGGIGGVEPDQNVTISWTASQNVDAIRGDLGALRSAKNFNGSVSACVLNDTTATSFADNTVLGPDSGFYWLARRSVATYCNESKSYSTGSPKEDPGRDTEIAADPDACP